MIRVLLFGMLLPLTAWPQTVKEVRKGQATVEGASGWVVGTPVRFLDSDLEEVGQGEVVKTSPAGGIALVKVVSGKAQAGASAEKREVVTPQPTESAKPYRRRSGADSFTEEERKILAQGEISQARYVIGGVLGTWPLGLGIGHAIQGRYTEKGWIFTVGELGSMAVMMAGVGDCIGRIGSNDNCSNSGGLILLGAMGFVGFRIWEIIDVWVAPGEHNRRYRELRSRANGEELTWRPILNWDGRQGQLGVALTF